MKEQYPRKKYVEIGGICTPLNTEWTTYLDYVLQMHYRGYAKVYRLYNKLHDSSFFLEAFLSKGRAESALQEEQLLSIKNGFYGDDWRIELVYMDKA